MAELSIKHLVKELAELRTEIKTRKDALKKLTQREKDIKDKIQSFLKSQTSELNLIK